MIRYFHIYFDEINQKVSRKQKRLQVVQNFYYMGQVTEVEYDLLIEILFRAYGENDITLEQFLIFFNELKEFSEKIEDLIK